MAFKPFKVWGMEFFGKSKSPEATKKEQKDTKKSNEGSRQTLSDLTTKTPMSSKEKAEEEKTNKVNERMEQIDQTEEPEKIFNLRDEIVDIVKGTKSEGRVEKILNPKSPEDLVDYIASVDNANTWYRLRIQAEYGQGNVNRFKNFLRGEYDFSLTADGKVRHLWWREMFRKGVNVFTNKKILLSAGFAGLIGFLSGGSAYAIMPAILGSKVIAGGVIGRGFGEAWDLIQGEEREARRQLSMAYLNEYNQLNAKAKEIKEIQDPDEKNKKIAELIDLTYAMSQQVAESRKNVEEIKNNCNKTKDKFTTAGLIVGSVANIYHGITNVKQTAQDLKIDLDADDHAHAVQKINGQWNYLYDSHQDITYMKSKALGEIMSKHPGLTSEQAQMIIEQNFNMNNGIGKFGGHVLQGATDQQIAQALEEARRNMPWTEVARHVWPDAGKTLAVLGASFLSPYIGKPSEIPRLQADWLKSTYKRLKAQVPKEEVSEKEKVATKEGKEQKILQNQIWIFEEGKKHQIFDLSRNTKIEIPTGNWLILDLDDKYVEMSHISAKTPDGYHWKIKISRKDLLEKGKLLTTSDAQEKQKQEQEKELEAKEIVAFKKQVDEGKNIIEFPAKLSKDFFKNNFNLDINTKEQHEILDFDTTNNKITIRNIETRAKYKDLDLLKFVDAILSLESPEKIKEKKEENKEKNDEYKELIKKFNNLNKDKPKKGAIWYFEGNIEDGIDNEGDSVQFTEGYYKITQAPDEKELMIFIRGLGEDIEQLSGKVKIEELLNDKFKDLNQAIKDVLNKKEIAGNHVPENKKLKKNQNWLYQYTTGLNPDAAAMNYRLSAFNDDGTVTLQRPNLAPAPAPRFIIRRVEQMELVDKGQFV